MQKKKLLVFCGPSGSGKTTIVHHLLNIFPHVLDFSVSASTRKARKTEVDGKDYYFISAEDFKRKIKKGEFVEWQEVYDHNFYGTLKSEIERIWKSGKNVIFDIDVEGGLSIKKEYPKNSIAVFVRPPSMEALRERLIARSTEDPEVLEKRVKKAAKELGYADKFDKVIINQTLLHSLREAEEIVKDFLKNEDGR